MKTTHAKCYHYQFRAIRTTRYLCRKVYKMMSQPSWTYRPPWFLLVLFDIRNSYRAGGTYQKELYQSRLFDEVDERSTGRAEQLRYLKVLQLYLDHVTTWQEARNWQWESNWRQIPHYNFTNLSATARLDLRWDSATSLLQHPGWRAGIASSWGWSPSTQSAHPFL